MVTIPFSILPPRLLESFSGRFMGFGTSLSKLYPYLELELKRADFKISPKRYLAMCVVATLFWFIFLGAFLTILLAKNQDYTTGVLIALVASLIIFFMQTSYPRLVSSRRVKKIDLDLLASLRAMMIQLNSGVPLFETMAIISKQQFGEVSKAFSEAIKKINAGTPQIEALEEMALKNPSPYFRRTLWQLINGMKEGATINLVLNNVITNLTKEQVIQIERYGSQLNPLAMFYMMGAIILPALGITFLIVITSFVELGDVLVKSIFWGLFAFVMFFQVMFSGIIKTKRPSLLG